jgi:hypothetical protein
MRLTSIVGTCNKFLSLNKRLEVYISESNGFVNIYRFITGGKPYNSKTSKSRVNFRKFPQLFELWEHFINIFFGKICALIQ